MYKLNEPEKNKQSVGYWLFVVGVILLFLFIVLINPLLRWGWESQGEMYTFVAIILGAFLLAGIAMIPTIRNDRSYNYALAKLWANREYIETDEFTEIIEILQPNVWKNNRSDEMLNKLQQCVDSHKGKHITGHKYYKKQYIKELELA